MRNGNNRSLLAAMAGLLVILAAAPQSGAQQTKQPETEANAPPALPIPWKPVSRIIDGMVKIPGTTYRRGSDEGEKDEGPARKIVISAFYIDRIEVTREAYAECVRVGACAPAREYPGLEDPGLPITGVNWFQAYSYCLWAGKRLPTEAEWELAARGTTDWLYPWGDRFDPQKLNFADWDEEETARGGTDGYDELAPAESFPEGASPFGLLNTLGNASEWVLDWYGRGYYRLAPWKNPRGPARGRNKVLRGGSFNDPRESEAPDALRVIDRRPVPPQTARPSIGFRCAWRSGEDLSQVGDPEPN